MQTFIENAANACVGADVAVMLLLSEDGQDIELWPLRPMVDEANLTPPQEFVRRRLRTVGALGLHGMQPAFVFKEPLPLFAVTAFGKAFADYVRSLLGENFAEQVSIAELERILALPDTRLN